MFIHKTALPRRRILKGMGAAMALPPLDAMVPALTTVMTSAAPRKRLGCVYIPHGAIMDRWTPATAGTGFEFTPILSPLEPFRDSLTIVTNLTGPEQGFDTNHAGAPASWHAGVPPKRTAGPDYALGITLDQLVARRVGQETMFPSIELATEDFTGLVGDCAPGFSCAYMNTLSWQSDTAPLPMEINPRVVFERLFGGGGSREDRLARMKTDRSLLDFVADDSTRRWRRRIGQARPSHRWRTIDAECRSPDQHGREVWRRARALRWRQGPHSSLTRQCD